jgi:hypothetical protein
MAAQGQGQSLGHKEPEEWGAIAEVVKGYILDGKVKGTKETPNRL